MSPFADAEIASAFTPGDLKVEENHLIVINALFFTQLSAHDESATYLFDDLTQMIEGNWNEFPMKIFLPMRGKYVWKKPLEREKRRFSGENFFEGKRKSHVAQWVPGNLEGNESNLIFKDINAVSGGFQMNGDTWYDKANHQITLIE